MTLNQLKVKIISNRKKLKITVKIQRLDNTKFILKKHWELIKSLKKLIKEKLFKI